MQLGPRRARRDGQGDGRAVWRRLDGVGQEVVDDLGQAVGSGSGRHAPTFHLQLHALVVGHRSPRLGPFAQDGTEVDDARGGRRTRALGPGQGQQAVDEAREAGDLPQRCGHTRDLGLGVGDLGQRALEQLEAQSQGGQRCAQLMGGVGHEGLLGADELLQPRGRLVDGGGQACRTSGGPWSVGMRVSSAPRPSAVVASSSWVRGRTTHRDSANPAAVAAPSVAAPITASVSQLRRTRASTAEVGKVTRTAPWTTPLDATGTAT